MESNVICFCCGKNGHRNNAYALETNPKGPKGMWTPKTTLELFVDLCLLKLAKESGNFIEDAQGIWQEISLTLRCYPESVLVTLRMG